MPDIRESRRAEIVRAARQLVCEGGLEKLTIGRLERSLPFTRGVITHHFDSRDDIVDALLASALDEIDRATAQQVRRDDDFEDQILAVLRSKVSGFLDHPEATDILLAFWTRAGFDARGRVVNRHLFRRYRTESSAWFAEWERADDLATLLVGSVIGIVLQVRLDPEVDADSAVRAAARCIALGWPDVSR